MDSETRATWPLRLGTSSDQEPRYDGVVLVTIDTLRPDHLSCYGYARETSPFLDRLASRGKRFTLALSSISHTAPAHATILTGLTPTTHGVVANGMELDSRAVGLPELFDASGYETAAFYNVGFLEGVSSGFGVARARLGTGNEVIEEADRWLREERESDRFFLWLHFYGPHYWQKADMTPPVELAQVRDELGWDEERFVDYIGALHGIDAEAMFSEESGPRLTKAKLVAAVNAYDAQILFVDRLLERFHRSLEELGLAQQVLWVVTSDHGEAIGAHGITGHTRHIYEEQLRIPLIVHAADGSIPPGVVDDIVQQIDILPTFADLLGTELVGLDAGLDGLSLWPLLSGSGGIPARAAFAERCKLKGRESLFALRQGRFKLLLEGGVARELFDLGEDPLELHDLAETHAEQVDQLEALLEEHLERSRNRSVIDATDDSEIREEWRDELRRLGYAE